MDFGIKKAEQTKQQPSVNKPRLGEVNGQRLGKVTNQALTVIVTKGLNIEDAQVQKIYKRIAKLLYALDNEIEAELIDGDFS